MEEERRKRNGWLARKMDLIIIILALLALFLSINNRIDSVNTRVDVLYREMVEIKRIIISSIGPMPSPETSPETSPNQNP